MPEVDVLADMNPRQRRAISHIDGPLLVIAGAGSGKTRVITHRIANLIQHGVRADRILAITFTNKAAGEMKERVWRLLGLQTPWVTTFHSAGLQILKLEEDQLQFENPFTILDADDQKRMLKRLLKSMELDENGPDLRLVQSQISNWKNQLKLPGQIQVNNPGDELMQQIYYNYEQVKKQDCMLDFDDLLLLPVHLFRQNPEILEKYRERFPYILIDEYQDTNHAQYVFIKMLGDHGNVCATGDPDQAIYGWRGANISNILNFEKDFPGCEQVLLEENYRSTGLILEAAQHVVENNTERKDKRVFTQNDKGGPINFITVDDNHEESRAIAVRCKVLHEQQGRSYADMAVFYRVNAQSRTLEEEFIRQNIPYRIIGGTRFYDRLEVKDVLAYLKLLINPRDTVSFERIVNTPARGIGEKTLQLIHDVCVDIGVGFHELLMNDEYLSRVAVGRSSRAMRDLSQLWRRMQRLSQDNAAECIAEIISMTALEEHYRNNDPGEKGEERIFNIFELQTAAESHGSVASFLDHVALFTAVDQRATDSEEVLLMTLHASKGLEFPVVFITGCEQGILPLVRKGSDCDYEEERRLMYVGITRAMEDLYISRAVHRMQYGETKRNPPSMFLAEMPDHCIQHRDATGRIDSARRYSKVTEGPAYPDASLAASSVEKRGATGKDVLTALQSAGALTSGSALASALRSGQSAQGDGKRKQKIDDDAPVGLAGDPFQAGDRVIHNTMGEGTVLRLSGPSSDRRISIEFIRGGVKELLLSFAQQRLSKID